MKNSKKNTRTAILAVVLLGLLVVAYKVVFVSAPVEDFSIEENMAASQRVEDVLLEVQRITFDTSVVTDPKFQSLKSIEIPLVNFPVGRANPFSPLYGSN